MRRPRWSIPMPIIRPVTRILPCQLLGQDHVGFGYVTHGIRWGMRTLPLADGGRKRRATSSIGHGSVTIRETVNAVEAWLGRLPGSPMPMSGNPSSTRSTSRI